MKESAENTTSSVGASGTVADAVGPPKATAKQWAGLIIMVVPLFMLSTDVTVLILALPSIATDLAPVGSQSLWILHISEFMAAATILTFGFLTQRVGPRRLLLFSVGVYGAASLLAAYATSAEMLIAARALLGVAAGGFTPAGMALIRATFLDSKQYAFAFAVFMAAFSGGMAAGPPFGGMMLEHFWWGSVFLINVPIAAVLLLGAPFLLAKGVSDTSVRLDPVSVVLSVAAILALVFGLQELSDSGAGVLPIGSTIVGLALLAVFGRRQRRTSAPLIDTSLFKLPQFKMLLVFLFVMMLGTTAADMLLAQYLQVIREMSPLQVGFVMLAPAVAATVGTMATPLMTRWNSPGIPLAAVLALAGLGGAATVLMLPGDDLVGIIVALSVFGFFGAPFITLLSQMVIGAAPKHRTGQATAIQDVTASLGMGSSFAFVGAGALGIYRQLLHDNTSAEIAPADVDQAGESFAGSIPAAQQLAPERADELLAAADTAFTTATQVGYGIAGATMVALAVVMFVMRKRLRAPA